MAMTCAAVRDIPTIMPSYCPLPLSFGLDLTIRRPDGGRYQVVISKILDLSEALRCGGPKALQRPATATPSAVYLAGYALGRDRGLTAEQRQGVKLALLLHRDSLVDLD